MLLLSLWVVGAVVEQQQCAAAVDRKGHEAAVIDPYCIVSSNIHVFLELGPSSCYIQALCVALFCELYDFLLDVLIGAANGWENIAVM